jgi:ring-1,2-phenylacetyl-CoA epoxidase subunit PaaC
MVTEVVARATLTLPPPPPTGRGYRRGDHTEYLGHLLAEMQILPRSHPGASW